MPLLLFAQVAGKFHQLSEQLLDTAATGVLALDQRLDVLQSPQASHGKPLDVLHDLRHSFAATAVGSGLGLPILAKLLGHKNLETTSKYAHLAIDPQKVAADQIGDLLERRLAGS